MYYGDYRYEDNWNRCANNGHDWVDTGLIKSYCRVCDAEGEWCRQKCAYVVKGAAKWDVSETNDNRPNSRDVERG
jgi:hypothetical protein